MRRFLLRGLRLIDRQFPGLRRYHGRLGLGRLAARGAGRQVIILDDDIRIELDLSIDWFRGLYFTADPGRAEETILLRHLLGREDVYVDVGAHIGYFALIGAKYGRWVHAFEPSPFTSAYLRRNLELNPGLAHKITVHRMALSDQAGQLPFYRPAMEPGAGSLRASPYADMNVESVPVDTLDNVLGENTANMIKIDVEGAELDVLRGAQKLLMRCRPVLIVELNVGTQQRFGRTCSEIVQFLESLDYMGRLVRSHPTAAGRLLIEPLNVSDFRPGQVSNALFLPGPHVAAILGQLPS